MNNLEFRNSPVEYVVFAKSESRDLSSVFVIDTHLMTDTYLALDAWSKSLRIENENLKRLNTFVASEVKKLELQH